MKKKYSKKIALVTGANRGIGLEISKQLAEKGFHVILTSRNKSKGINVAKKLLAKNLDVEYFLLDVTKEKSIKDLLTFLKKKYNHLDVLVNNAGVLLDRKESKSTSVFDVDLSTIKKTLETNTYGPLLLCKYLIPLMKKNNYGRIVNISSGMGQLTDMFGGYPGYRLSKVSLNAVTKIFSDETKKYNILINSMCPGWVRTDMGGMNATRSVEKGAETAIWLATLPKNGTRGGFFRDKKQIPW